MFEKDVEDTGYQTVWDKLEEQEKKSPKKGHPWLLLILCLGLLGAGIGLPYMVSEGIAPFYNVGPDEWAIKQNWEGELSVVDFGHHWKGTGNVHIYPREDILHYAETSTIRYNDGAIMIKFSDGHVAEINTIVRVKFPTSTEGRIALHKLITNKSNSIVKEIELVLQEACSRVARKMTADESFSFLRAELFNTIQTEIPKVIKESESNVPLFRYINIHGITLASVRYSAVFSKCLEERNWAEQALLKARYEAEEAKFNAEKERWIAEQEIWKKEWEDANSIEEGEAIQAKHRAIVAARIAIAKAAADGAAKDADRIAKAKAERIALLMENRGREKIDPNNFPDK